MAQVSVELVHPGAVRYTPAHSATASVSLRTADTAGGVRSPQMSLRRSTSDGAGPIIRVRHAVIFVHVRPAL